jgi:hypothetical protein
LTRENRLRNIEIDGKQTIFATEVVNGSNGPSLRQVQSRHM